MLSAYELLSESHIRGKQYFVAPGTDPFPFRSSRVTPDDSNSGLFPLRPFATVNRAFDFMQDGDTLVLLKEGDYMLSNNIVSSLGHIKMLPWPGLHPQLVTIHGVTGGAPMEMTGRGVYMGGFSIETGDDGFGDLIVRGAYSILEEMHFDSDGDNQPVYGLRLVTGTGGGVHASSCQILRCRFSDCSYGILVGFTAGDYAGPTDVLVDDCRFRNNVLWDINQEDNSGINGWVIKRSSFETSPQDVDDPHYIRLPNTLNGAEQLNMVADCAFAIKPSGTPADAFSLTSGKFRFSGNTFGGGFITTV